ncbi:MAG: polyphosphate:AMP phosphotransferase [Gammaproteobacteria bacterium]
MFEAVELGQKISKKEFDQEEPELRTRLLGLQHTIRETRIPVIVIVSGVEGAGKGEVVNRLSKWLDPRSIETSAFWDESDEERERPRYWRFWRRLPARGTFGIMFGSWYTRPIVDFVMGRIDNSEYERQLHHITQFEQLLTVDGALIVKFWFHLSGADQKKKLEKDKKAGRPSPILKQFSKHYAEFASASEHALRMTDTGDAPWHLIEAANDRYRDISVGRVLKAALEEKLESSSVTATRNDRKIFTSIPDDDITILDHVDTTRTIPEKDYRKQLKDYQNEIYRLVWEARKQKRSTIAMFEGWDASGKGGAIRRLTAGMDARLYKVISVAAPTDEEKAHHYLWRFWRHLPRAGYVTVYDRSWYGRVLVERVENFATEDEWRRAYGEINDFEEQLHEHGIILTKFWLHLDPEEQLRRFKEREVTAWKQHKITEEDWRNREKWDDYKAAVNDMVAHTSTEYAPWSLIPANDKLFARIEILKTVHDRLSEALEKN